MKPLDAAHLTVSVPWPVRLFGEGMECFGLPVLSVALNLRTAIRVTKRDDDFCSVRGHRVDAPITFDSDLHQLRGAGTRALSLAIKALQTCDVALDRGYDFELFTLVPEIEDVPNSPALLVAWVATLLTLSEQVKDKSGNEIANLACAALDKGPDSAGAIADIHACVLGGATFIRDPGNPVIEQIERALPGMVYAYPTPPVSTLFCLSEMRERARSAIAAATAALPGFTLSDTPLDDILPKLSEPALKEYADLVYAHLSNRDACVTCQRKVKMSSFVPS